MLSTTTAMGIGNAQDAHHRLCVRRPMETLEDLEAEGVEVNAELVTDDQEATPTSITALTDRIDREDVIDDRENDDDDAEESILDEQPLDDGDDDRMSDGPGYESR